MAIATADPTIVDGRHTRRVQTVGRVFGWFFLATFLTSIPAYFIGYANILDDPGLITGAGADPATSVATAAALEVFLIVANVATAVVVYPILKRESEIGALGYVSARLVEGIFIAIGLVSVLAFLLMRQEGTAVSDSRSRRCVRRDLLPSVPRRTWLLRGPRERGDTGLPDVPIRPCPSRYGDAGSHRGPTRHDHRGSPSCTTRSSEVEPFKPSRRSPSSLWELSLSIYCIVKGFRLASPILRRETVTTLPESDSALRYEA